MGGRGRFSFRTGLTLFLVLAARPASPRGVGEAGGRSKPAVKARTIRQGKISSVDGNQRQLRVRHEGRRAVFDVGSSPMVRC